LRRRAGFLRLALVAFALVIWGGVAGWAKAQSDAELKVAREHVAAVALARRGDTAQALVLLARLARQSPHDAGIQADLVVVLTWADRNREAIDRFARLPAAARRDYVVAAVGRALRAERRYAAALALYRSAARRFGRDPRFAAGEIETLADQGRTAAALDRAERALAVLPRAVLLLVAAAYAAEAAGRPADALNYADRALAQAPDDHEALRQRVLAVGWMGMPDAALRLAQAHPGLLTPAERRSLEGDSAAELVRWDHAEPAAEAERFAAADRAIAALDRLIGEFSTDGPAAAAALRRARCDRVVAYYDRARMADAVAEYEALRRGGPVPAYVLKAAAGAYLALRRPREARVLYLEVLQGEPRNVAARLGLFHALVESEDFDEAFRVVDQTAQEVRTWIRLKGAVEPLPNPDKLSADVAAADARLYAGELAEAERRLSALADEAPNNTPLLESLAEVYEARGWPRRARGTLEIAHAEDPRDSAVDVALAQAAFDLQDWPAFEQATEALMQRLPEDGSVRRLDREAAVHEGAELEASVGRVWAYPTNLNGGNALTAGARLFSPPIFDYWRAFAGWSAAHERVPEGTITERIYTAGVDYRGPAFDAEAEARLIADGAEQGGGRLAGAWRPDDAWSFGAAGEIFSTDTPLRALKNGVTADSATLTAAWRGSESERASASLEQMPFSDGNERTALGLDWHERLVTAPLFRLDGIGALGASQNTRRDAPYYNPMHDALGTAGIEAADTLFRRYEFSWQQALTLSAGPYWEQAFGTTFAWSARYEQSVGADDFRIAAGLGFARQTYDGSYQNAVTLDFQLDRKF
jgi:biofilm PGA synthesis protein PgaA